MRTETSKADYIAKAGLIAALYAGLCLALQSISFGPVQVRVANALMILPYFTSAAIPGLYVGCLIANLIGGGVMIDVVAGSFVTLFGAIGARLLRNTPWLMPLPTLILNILVVPQILKYGYGVPLPIPLSMLYIGIGAFIACYVLGMLLFGVLKQIAPYIEDRAVRAR